MKTLKEKTATGLVWGAVNNLMTQLLMALIGIVLGRLLSPRRIRHDGHAGYILCHSCHPQ